jgi:hypothetical protein
MASPYFTYESIRSGILARPTAFGTWRSKLLDNAFEFRDFGKFFTFEIT